MFRRKLKKKKQQLFLSLLDFCEIRSRITPKPSEYVSKIDHLQNGKRMPISCSGTIAPNIEYHS